MRGAVESAATREIERVGLRVGKHEVTALAKLDTGIYSELPQPGVRVDSNSMVDLIENRPAEVRRVTVPDLGGRTLAAARIVLGDSLVLGEPLRPAVNAVDSVVEQLPNAGATVFVRSVVTVRLASRSAGPLIRIPDVVNFTVDSATRTLGDSGFRNVAITPRDGALTSTSRVESQAPAGGTFAAPDSVVRLVAVPVPPRPEPTPRPPLPVPLAHAVPFWEKLQDLWWLVPVVLVLVGGVLAYLKSLRPGAPTSNPPTERPTHPLPGNVTLTAHRPELQKPVLHADGANTLVRSAITFHFAVESSQPVLALPGDSIIKHRKGRDV